MKFYGITCLVLGCSLVIEISDDEFTRITNAKRNFLTILGIEEKFDLVLENYLEYERELLSLNLQRMLLQDFDGSSSMNSVQTINRRLANHLMTARVYLDQVQHDLKTVYRENSEFPRILKQKVSEQYDNSRGFRVMEALRNFIQHRSLPVHELIHRMEPDNSCSPPQFRYVLEPYIEVLQLRDDPKFKRSILAELEQMGKLVNVTPLVRQHIEALGRVHQELRRHTAQDIEVWEHVLETVITRARESFGDVLPGLPGLAVVAGEQRDIYDQSEPIFSSLLARRLFLQRKNSNLGFLSRRYVSGAYTENAV